MAEQSLLPVFGFRRRVRLLIKGGISLDSLMKRYVVAELLLGIAAVVVGLFLGGPTLPALGLCAVALAVQCSVFSHKYHGLVFALGLFSLLGLTVCGVASFLHIISLSGYEDRSSSLWVLFAVAVFLLIQRGLSLPLEDRKDLNLLRRGVSRMILFSALGFAGIVLTYLLSYLWYSVAVNALEQGSTMQDFHYLEGVVALAFVLTSARGVLRGFFGKEPLTESIKEDRNDQKA